MKKTLLAAVAALALLLGAIPHAHATDDGSPSTGTFTINYSTNLAAATASGTLTVLDTSSLLGTVVYVGSYRLRAGVDYIVGASTVATAINITAAINAYPPNVTGTWPNMPVTAAFVQGNAVITLTAIDSGSAYNQVQLLTSNTSEITVSAANLTGGLNNASACINAVCLVQGRDWLALDVSSNTAVSLASAINHAAGLKNVVQGYWTGGSTGVVYLKSLFFPTAYPLTASDNSAGNTNLTPSAATMAGNTSVGNLAKNECYVGAVDALPSIGYQQGCILTLNSDATHLYISTKAVTGAEAGSAYWLAK